MANRSPNMIVGPDAGHAGERSFRDFFRLPPTKENRSQSGTLRVVGVGNFVNAGAQMLGIYFRFDRHPPSIEDQQAGT
jgi:hypothetical protein